MFKKTMATLILLLMLCPSVMGAQSVFLTFVKSGADYSHVIAHLSFESESANLTKFSGPSGAINWDDGSGAFIDTTVYKVGTASFFHEYEDINFPVDGNVIGGDGCVGVWYKKETNSGSAGILSTVGNDLKVTPNATGYTGMDYRGVDGNLSTPTFGDTYFTDWHFYWVKMDGNTASFYVDDTLILTTTGTATFDDTVFQICRFDAVRGWFDNFISSNDKNFNLYSIALVEDFT